MHDNDIRKQLTYYNQNCRDQRAKIDEMGYNVDDFVEVRSNKGVKKPFHSRITPAGQAFSSACEQGILLPDFLEMSLTGGYKFQPTPKAVTMEDNGGGGPFYAIIGGAVAGALLAFGIVFLIFQYRLKKKKDKALHRISEVDGTEMDIPEKMSSNEGLESGQLNDEDAKNVPNRSKSSKQKRSKLAVLAASMVSGDDDEPSSSSSSSDDDLSSDSDSSESLESSSQVRRRKRQEKKASKKTPSSQKEIMRATGRNVKRRANALRGSLRGSLKKKKSATKRATNNGRRRATTTSRVSALRSSLHQVLRKSLTHHTVAATSKSRRRPNHKALCNVPRPSDARRRATITRQDTFATAGAVIADNDAVSRRDSYDT